jgi:hypothetical protein
MQTPADGGPIWLGPLEGILMLRAGILADASDGAAGQGAAAAGSERADGPTREWRVGAASWEDGAPLPASLSLAAEGTALELPLRPAPGASPLQPRLLRVVAAPGGMPSGSVVADVTRDLVAQARDDGGGGALALRPLPRGRYLLLIPEAASAGDAAGGPRPWGACARAVTIEALEPVHGGGADELLRPVAHSPGAGEGPKPQELVAASEAAPLRVTRVEVGNGSGGSSSGGAVVELRGSLQQLAGAHVALVLTRCVSRPVWQAACN